MLLLEPVQPLLLFSESLARYDQLLVHVMADLDQLGDSCLLFSQVLIVRLLLLCSASTKANDRSIFQPTATLSTLVPQNLPLYGLNLAHELTKLVVFAAEYALHWLLKFDTLYFKKL